jgi:hypothetical protein
VIQIASRLQEQQAFAMTVYGHVVPERNARSAVERPVKLTV